MLIFTDMKTNLKPCPFCGGVAKKYDCIKIGFYYYISCTECSCEIFGSNELDVTKQWNTRHDEMNLKKVLLLIPELAIKILALAVLAAGVYWIFA